MRNCRWVFEEQLNVCMDYAWAGDDLTVLLQQGRYGFAL